MSTIREALEADVASLEKKLADGTARLTAAIAAEKAKLEGLHPTLLAVLEHPLDEVQAFFRKFGAQLFPGASHEAVAKATSIETKVYSDGSSATGPGPLPDLSPAQQAAAAATATTTTEGVAAALSGAAAGTTVGA